MKEANDNKNALIESAVGGNADALEELLAGIQDMVFNLSLRMLGTIPDAEDAAQEILVRVMTNLGTFRRESDFQTWVYRIAVNYLLNYKKSMFAHQPLDFEFYGNDIKYAVLDETEGLIEEESRQQLAEELKLSCTNVMLQCLDAESRCIFILGTMFRINSRTAGEILQMSPREFPAETFQNPREGSRISCRILRAVRRGNVHLQETGGICGPAEENQPGAPGVSQAPSP